MKRFILEDTPDSMGRVLLSGRDYHYLVNVRRFKAGSVFNAFLPSGEEVQIRVQAVEHNSLIGFCSSLAYEGYEESDNFSQKIPHIVLFQAMPKAAKMDLIVRQAAEIGINEIVLFISEYSMPKQEFKLERWNKIIKEARQQSGSPIETAIKTPYDIMTYWEELKSHYDGIVGLLFHHVKLEEGSFHLYLNSAPCAAVLAIGPEGGFSEKEAGRFMSVGFRPLMLGQTILRTETAALYASAAVRTLILESELWITKSR